jgi:hypothetical protein
MLKATTKAARVRQRAVLFSIEFLFCALCDASARFFFFRQTALVADEEARCLLVRSDQINWFVDVFQKAVIRLQG